jgi:hypothetical protein
MHKYIFEIIEEAKNAKTRPEKIAILNKNESWALKDVIKGTLDPTVEWLLPKGPVPYKPCEAHNAPTNLLRQNKQFAYFVKGGKGSRRIQTIKRESIFLALIEGIHPKDAEIVVGMINKKPFGGGLTPKLINEAFPNLLSNSSE